MANYCCDSGETYAGKRPLDIIVSSLALLGSAPACLIVAAAIRVDSRGPVFFRQDRIGKSGKPFVMLKFRTMIDRDAVTIDQRNEAVVTSGRDPRITRVGRLLRVTSFDEVPQFVNVLRGDMSLVGPRPVLPPQAQAVPPEYRSRFSVLPGITGLAQVQGRRSLGWIEQLEAEVEYVRRASLPMDIEILLKTFLGLFKGQGVYADASKNWRNYSGLIEEPVMQEAGVPPPNAN
ncbi:sugar transferase [Serinicoccus sp. LYQ131]|uniref:sugar transferase n=1 Tax=Serinicoccus sp. LYQ131 TaxID=3378797 RepID=UPI0038544C51